jgi:hypothetical protein
MGLIKLLGQVDQRDGVTEDQRISFDQFILGVEGFHQAVLLLGIDAADDEVGGMLFGEFIVLVVEVYFAIEEGLELVELVLVVIGEGVVLLDVLLEQEVELFGKGGGVEEVVEGQVAPDILDDFPAVEQILRFLHYQRIIKILILATEKAARIINSGSCIIGKEIKYDQ